MRIKKILTTRWSHRGYAASGFKASLQGDPTRGNPSPTNQNKNLRPSRLNPASEAAGPQGQAGSAWLKFHISLGEGIFRLLSLLVKIDFQPRRWGHRGAAASGFAGSKQDSRRFLLLSYFRNGLQRLVLRTCLQQIAAGLFCLYIRENDNFLFALKNWGFRGIIGRIIRRWT